jgi:hypothetical protein
MQARRFLFCTIFILTALALGVLSRSAGAASATREQGCPYSVLYKTHAPCAKSKRRPKPVHVRAARVVPLVPSSASCFNPYSGARVRCR